MLKTNYSTWKQNGYKQITELKYIIKSEDINYENNITLIHIKVKLDKASYKGKK